MVLVAQLLTISANHSLLENASTLAENKFESIIFNKTSSSHPIVGAAHVSNEEVTEYRHKLHQFEFKSKKIDDFNFHEHLNDNKFNMT